MLKKKVDEKTKEINKVEKNNKRMFEITIKKVIFLLAILAILIIASIFSYLFMFKNKENDYDKKMDMLGFSTVYDDNEDLSKIEALKIIVSAIENNIASYTDNTYTLNYAVSCRPNVASYINTDNMNEKITYKDALVILSSLYNNYKKTPYKSDENNNVNDKSGYNIAEKRAINDMLANGMVSKDEDFNIELTKEIFNKVIINTVYNGQTLISYGSTNDKMQLDENKKPKNNSIYPYILSDVEKSIYEISPLHKGDKGYKTPFESYLSLRTSYKLINESVNNYFKNVLNVNYQSIDTEKLYENLATCSKIDKNIVNKYVEYVKANNIVIEGTSKTIIPVIYKTEKYTYVRVKLNYKIISSNTTTNLILGDEDTKGYAVNKEYEKIIDIKVLPFVFDSFILEYNLKNITVK